MRIAYFIILMLAVLNLCLYSLGLLTGVNVYEKYGKNILKFFAEILTLLIAGYIAFIIAGLV